MRRDVFKKDPRFQNSIEWIYFMLDYNEKRRLQYQQLLRVLYDDSVNYTKKDLLVTSNTTIRS